MMWGRVSENSRMKVVHSAFIATAPHHSAPSAWGLHRLERLMAEDLTCPHE